MSINYAWHPLQPGSPVAGLLHVTTLGGPDCWLPSRWSSCAPRPPQCCRSCTGAGPQNHPGSRCGSSSSGAKPGPGARPGLVGAFCNRAQQTSHAQEQMTPAALVPPGRPSCPVHLHGEDCQRGCAVDSQTSETCAVASALQTTNIATNEAQGIGRRNQAPICLCLSRRRFQWFSVGSVSCCRPSGQCGRTMGRFGSRMCWETAQRLESPGFMPGTWYQVLL